MAWINSYAVSCNAGDSVDALWSALSEGRVPPSGHFTGKRSERVRELLVGRLLHAFHARPRGSRFGVLLASTKGCSNDFIWDGPGDRDPLTPVLEEFLIRAELKPERSLCVSNACSSTLAALELARLWLAQGLEDVIVLAADAVTPFVEMGFRSLGLTTTETPRPFAQERSGFFLGEAAAVLNVSRRREGFFLYPIGLDAEGYAVARPSQSGESLTRAGAALANKKPDVVIAHGTGTEINDATEDLAFSKLFPEGTPPITGSKWCVGHTLAASAAIDTILACEILRRGEVFGLMTTSAPDPGFHGRYQLRFEERACERVLISSLGFGGMHAMAMVAKHAP